MSLVNFSQIKGGKQLQDNVDKKANITDVYNVDSAGKKTALYRKNTDKIVLEDLDKSLQDTIQPFTPRKINLVGNASGSATYDGLNDVNIDTTINESEHAVTADSADKLSTSKKINLIGNATGSTTFDGSTDANINVTVNESKHAATADTATTATNANHAGTADNADTVDGIHAASLFYCKGRWDENNWATIGTYTVYGNPPVSGAYQWGQVISISSLDMRFQLYASDLFGGSGRLYYRTGWQNNKHNWNTILDSENYNLFAPTKTGDGASGTWGINITGNAASATNASSADSATLNKAGYPLEAIVAKSLDRNGYIKYASGLIVQWGRIDVKGTSGIVNLPITFPTKALAIIGGLANSGATVNDGESFEVINNTQVKVYLTDSLPSAVTYNYIVIGC